MTTRYQPAAQHVHFRANGWGLAGHQHVVRSEIHEHHGLRSVELGWAVYRWTYVRSRVVDLTLALIAIVLCLAMLTVAFTLLVST